MKKLIALFLTLILLNCLVLPLSGTDQVQAQSSTQTPPQKNSKEVADLVFKEIPLKESPYPQASLNVSIPVKEIQNAMATYYRDNYSQEEKKQAKDPFNDIDILTLQKTFKENDAFKKFKIDVDVVTLKLAGDTLQVARVILPMTYRQAENIQEGQDLMILNESLAHLGNHLVMIAYYNKDTKTLTPLHLTNANNPLFYNAEIE